MLRLISGFKDLEVWETRECALRLKSEGRVYGEFHERLSLSCFSDQIEYHGILSLIPPAFRLFPEKISLRF